MENKLITLRQDKGTDFKKRSVEISEEKLNYELKKHFKWRKGNPKERFFKLGTTDFDGFIQTLIDLGYKEVK